jgi:catechol 2,3-dioxygenase-like lactoylglutathione lyase family enzyme
LVARAAALPEAVVTTSPIAPGGRLRRQGRENPGRRRYGALSRRGISAGAVKYHVRSITQKLGVPDSRALRHWPGYPAGSARAAAEEAGMSSTGPRLTAVGQVSLLIRRVDRAETFYRDRLGLPHLFTFGDLAFFDCGGTRLFLRQVQEDQWRPGSIVYFVVDDIGKAHAELGERGVGFDDAPHLVHRDDDTGVEEWMAFFSDTEGNTLALMSRLAPPGPA